MVCLGNICRSPLAEGIMQHLINQEGLNWEVDSAGTAGYHIGAKPDYRSVAVAKKNGIDISKQKARKLEKADLEIFDISGKSIFNKKYTDVSLINEEVNLSTGVYFVKLKNEDNSKATLKLVKE